MAKIKAYTTIEQSRKLAEILPLESADMYYDRGGLPYLIDKYVTHESIKNNKYHHLIPCWSLAVLLDVLPQSVEFKGDKYYLRFMKDYVEYANDEVSITGRYLHTTGNDNLVDACVDMIEKLHELNLL